MVSYGELTLEQLLALMAVNYGPIRKCSDRRWRSTWKNFPSDGISSDTVFYLWNEQLVEWTENVAIVTDEGRAVLEMGEWARPFSAVTAMSGTQSAHTSLQ